MKRLNHAQVIEIYGLLEKRTSLAKIAEMYGMSPLYISKLSTGRAWKSAFAAYFKGGPVRKAPNYIEAAKARAVEVLRASPGLHLCRLARAIGVSESYMIRVANALEDDGLAVSSRNGVKRLLHLNTAQGEKRT